MDNIKLNKMSLVAEKTLSLCEKRGVEAITISQVARLAGVSRPWIYKYIGSTAKDLVAFAMIHFGNEFALLESRPRPLNADEWLQSLNSGLVHLIQILFGSNSCLRAYLKDSKFSVGSEIELIDFGDYFDSE